MSPDEILLLKILRELKNVKLETILVGNVACALQGVPVMTQDIDFFVRDTSLNRKKIMQFAKNLKLSVLKPDEALSDMIRTENKEMVVDFVFRLGDKQSFERVRAHSKRVKIGNINAVVASLEDVLLAKKEADRPKDRVVIKLIEETIRIRNEIKKG
jgi:predicted nucleotidyltransferase|uniref:Nucleotidyltransferase n=1 Tax=Thermodesulfobium narugense TaxID=184064 RepID=A0A7C5KBW0_9BACT